MINLITGGFALPASDAPGDIMKYAHAAGITGEPLTHEEVIETSRKGAKAFKTLIRGIVQRLGMKVSRQGS